MAKIINTFSQSIFPFILYVFLASFSIQISMCDKINPKNYNVNGMFVFGTSVVDNGNNNNINGSLATANYLPYGIDFINGPTGRFSNGKNLADKIGDLLNLPFIPPFAATGGGRSGVLHGVNYGSGGSGILDATGSIVNGVINFNQQIRNFENVTLPALERLFGNDTQKKLGRYLFLIAEGNNDFLLNYLLQPNSSRPSVPAFVANLTATYSGQLKRLYNVGARKFVLSTVYPIGCSPVVKDVAKSQECVETVNKAARFYNTQLINLVDDLKLKLPSSNFVVVNTFKIISDIIKHPIAKGFSNVTSACCELKEILPGFALSCKEGGNVCKDRSKYVFFDGQHNTEAVNAVIAAKAFASKRKIEVYPYNLRTLAQL